ncbi:MAG: SRPBCC family protein [Myxococcota bacterium]
MSTPSIVHATFSVERTYPARAARVFAAFSDAAKKRRWFAEGEGFHVDEYTNDFRVGGHEFSRFRFKDGPSVTNDTVYLDIIDEKRIVFSYVMDVAGKRISASLASVELFPSGKGTRLVFTEQGQYFDGADQPRQRELGSKELLEHLAKELDQHQ